MKSFSDTEEGMLASFGDWVFTKYPELYEEWYNE